MEFLTAVFNWFASHPEIVGKIVLGSILLAFISVVLTVVAIVRMSPDYFLSSKPGIKSWRHRHLLLRILFKMVKSTVGLILLITGIAMLVLPGQGLLTLLVGVGLLDFPGKRHIELRVVRNHHLLKAINWIRARTNQAPVIVD
jgi:hypothetical protein